MLAQKFLWYTLFPICLNDAIPIQQSKETNILVLRLKPEFENRLANIIVKTGRMKTFYAIKAIDQQLDDMEDYYLTEQSYNDQIAEGKNIFF